ncbi:MAG: alpha/beta hydrolase [Acidobacteria bacterium]|nr:alpha/beta hydrolase [Acidobacteriota bacterium]
MTATVAARQEASGQSANSQARAQGIEGIWLGTLDANGVKLRLVLKVSKGPGGKFRGMLDSLDQGANDLPIDTLSFDAGRLRFEMRALGASFEGTMNKDGTEISGQFQQGGSLPLIFKRTDKVPALNRPQEPQKPFPYDEEEVVYENKRDGIKIAGTLTRPRTGGPFPAVLLITGSGSQDRNETIMGHRPFLVLSDYLTRKGIAVLRVDDRGVGGTSVGTPNDTDENFVADALAGVEFLKTRKGINPKQIGLVGHSEGGMIAPMAAVESKDIAFIVMMAGLGVPGDRLILLQNELLSKAEGAGDESRAQSRVMYTRIFAILKEEKDNAAAMKKIQAALEQQLGQMTEAQKQAFAPIKAIIDAQTGMYVTPWFRFFLLYDPRPVLIKVKCPVLAINGERDLQVAPEENLAGIRDALKAGGNKDYTIIQLSALNHLLQTSKTGAVSEYLTIEETMSPTALETIANWILKRTDEQNRAAPRSH